MNVLLNALASYRTKFQLAQMKLTSDGIAFIRQLGNWDIYHLIK